MAETEKFNWFLVIVAVIVSVLTVLCNVYVLVHFQHPDDRNQAKFPKLVVVTGLTMAVLSILLLPLDVANRAACAESIIESACSYTLPMTELWYAMYMTMFAYIFVLIPWTLFYYEQDSETPHLKRVMSSSIWSVATTLVLLMIMLIVYYVGGEAEFELKSVDSGMMLLGNSALSDAAACIALPSTLTSATDFVTSPGSISGTSCNALSAGIEAEIFKVKPTFIVYIIAVCSIVSWMIFMVYAGVGIVAMPIDLVKSFLTRPVKIIPKSEYIRCATILARDVQSVTTEIKNLQKEQRLTGRTKKVRNELNALQLKLTALEDDELELQKVFPQGETREATWLLTMLGYYLQLFLGGVSVLLSIFWTIHIVLYVLISPPPSPFLNTFFQYLDGVWSLLGTAVFAIFLLLFGLLRNQGKYSSGIKVFIHQSIPDETWSYVHVIPAIQHRVNHAGQRVDYSVLRASFLTYTPRETSVTDIFGGNIENLKGLGYLFKYNIFIYCFFGMICLSLMIVPFQNYKVKPPRKAYEIEV